LIQLAEVHEKFNSFDCASELSSSSSWHTPPPQQAPRGEGDFFFIRDYNPEQNEDNVLATMLDHKEAIISHLSWARKRNGNAQYIETHYPWIKPSKKKKENKHGLAEGK
jgi:hypothetical protein